MACITYLIIMLLDKKKSTQSKSTAHGCWTLDFFASDIKLQAIYIIIEKLHFLKKF